MLILSPSHSRRLSMSGYRRIELLLLKEEPSAGPTECRYTWTSCVCMVLRTDWRGGEKKMDCTLKTSRLFLMMCLRSLSLLVASIPVNSDLPMMVDWRWCSMEKIGMQGFRLSTCLNVVSIFSPSVVTVLSPIVNFLSLSVFFSFLICYLSSRSGSSC